MSYIGLIIRNIRKMHNLTQGELGQILNVKKSTIQKYENGSITNLKIETVRKLTMHFNLPTWIFIFSEEFGKSLEEDETLLYHMEWNRNTFFFSAARFYSDFFQLNDFAMEKVHDYIHDLIKIEEYKREYPQKLYKDL